MQVLQAGDYKYILLELENEEVSAAAKQAGFESKLRENDRNIQLDLTALDRQNPLLLFDAADPANLGWFSRCQFYVDGRTGGVMQTPISVANKRDRSGRSQVYSVRVKINKELPATFRLPGRQPITEQVFYALFQNFLHALTRTGVAVCGNGLVQPLAGRTENYGPRN
ncbi:MAG TPA: hypothetical protein DEQ47_08505 [Solibacterales bacterium]|jgi:hypothetical protein|nr:hypothetical protein [Bryobacterales bacterium]